MPDNPPYNTDREQLELECEVEFFIAGGPGGQHRNRRETGVRIVHPPSGLTVTATERRSQVRNLDVAYERLIERLEQLNTPEKPRKNTRPPRSATRKRLDFKKRNSDKKALRKAPRQRDE